MLMAGKTKAYDCLFCDLCGTLLNFDSTTYASCALCGNRRDVKDFQGKEMRCSMGPQDFMRRWGMEPFIAPLENGVARGNDTEEVQQRAVVHEECPKCSHPSLEYYTRQLRSADEGQTVFYECPNCHHKFSQNM